MIDVGLIGFGFAGRTFHAPIITSVPGLRLAAIVQRTASEAATQYPDAIIARSVEELLSIDTLRVVVIATPNRTHFDLAKQCLLAGRDVIIDKPFAASYEEAAELVQLAQDHRRLLSVYHNRRWDGDFLTVQQLLNSRRLGRTALFESHFDRFRPQVRSDAWRERAEAGSGILFDLGPHLIDQALLLFGAPEAITADVRRERDAAVTDDAFDIVLHYPNLKLLALLRASMLASAPTPRFLLQGTAGSYLKFGLDPQEDALKRGETPQQNKSWGKEPQAQWGTLRVLENGSLVEQAVPTAPGDYRKCYENVRDALLGEADLVVSPQQALNVMQAIELARESSRRGCTVPWPTP